MKNSIVRNIVILIVTIALIFAVRMIEALPWWSFVVPIFILGVLAAKGFKWEIPGFTLGFLAGFIVWFGVNWYIDNANGSIVMNRLAQLLSINKWLVLLGAGVIGGLLSGLALSAGEQMFSAGKSKLLAE
jgi:hypothetical protein